MAYWGKVAKQTLRDTQLLQPWRAYAAVGTAVLSPIVQWEIGNLTLFSALALSIGSGLAVYIVLSVGEYAARFVATPAKLDRERVREIDALIAAQPPPISVAFTGIELQPDRIAARNVRMILRLSISTSTSRATLGEWALRSALKPDLKPTLTHVTGLGRHVGGNTIALDEHDWQRGLLEFDFAGLAAASEAEIRDARHEWTLIFSDAHKEHSERIPIKLYT